MGWPRIAARIAIAGAIGAAVTVLLIGRPSGGAPAATATTTEVLGYWVRTNPDELVPLSRAAGVEAVMGDSGVVGVRLPRWTMPTAPGLAATCESLQQALPTWEPADCATPTTSGTMLVAERTIATPTWGIIRAGAERSVTARIILVPSAAGISMELESAMAREPNI